MPGPAQLHISTRDVVSRLSALGPKISKICAEAGTPGASIGVLHKGEVIHTSNYGYRDVEKKLTPDENTLYNVFSLSKAITTQGLALLVDEGLFEWKSKLHELVPKLNQVDAKIQSEVTLEDALSHRTGLASQTFLIMQEFGRLCMPMSETTNTVSNLPKIAGLREKWIYSNWGHGLAAAELFPRYAGKSWGNFLQTRIFDPLGMTRTGTDPATTRDNVAQPYIILEDGSPFLTEKPKVGNNTVMSGACGVVSSVHDLLLYYKELLRVATDERLEAEPGCVFKRLSDITKVQINLEGDLADRRGYGLGWLISRLPAPMGEVGLNGALVDTMPIVGKGSEDRIVWHHSGSVAGALSAVHLLPETETAIVVLTNALGKNDCADWLAQMVLEAVIDNPDKNDYEAFSARSARKSVEIWHEMNDRLLKDRHPDPRIQAYRTYAGQFWNEAHNFFLDIFEDGEVLYLSFNADRRVRHRLEAYQDDAFSWIMSWDDVVQLGMFRYPLGNYYILRFHVENSRATAVTWALDFDLPDGQSFLRDEAATENHVSGGHTKESLI